MSYHVFVYLKNGEKLSILKRYSHIKNKETYEFAAFSFFEALREFDDRTWNWRDPEVHWSNNIKSGKCDSQLFEMVPFERLLNFLKNQVIVKVEDVNNAGGFRKEFSEALTREKDVVLDIKTMSLSVGLKQMTGDIDSIITFLECVKDQGFNFVTLKNNNGEQHYKITRRQDEFK